VEEVLSDIARLLPAHKRQLLLSILDRTAPKQSPSTECPNEAELNTLLRIAQICVSESSFFEDSSAAADWLKRLLALSTTLSSPPIARRVIGVAHLIVNRIADPRLISADDINQILAVKPLHAFDKKTASAIDALKSEIANRTRPPPSLH